MADTVQDPESPIMNLCLKKVDGIDEPVKLITGVGFAVGARTNNVYVWQIDYEAPEEQLDGVVEEEKENVAQLVIDPILMLSVAHIVPYHEEAQAPSAYKCVKSTLLQTALLAECGGLCLIDHKNGLGPEILTSKIKLTNLKSIVQLDASLSHFIALKKSFRKPLREWDPATLAAWMGRNGFEQCINIIKFGRITGAMLSDASYEFMSDTLGITDENACSKLELDLRHVRKECLQDCALFGWGNNKHGQLGIKKANIVSAPRKIDLPAFITLDETNKNLDSITTQQSILIAKIFCGNRFSGFLLSNGAFWACGNCAQAGKTTVEESKGANLTEEEKQMQKDEEFAKLVAAKQDKAKESSEEYPSSRDKGKNKNRKKEKNKQGKNKDAGQPVPKSKKAVRWEKKMAEEQIMREKEATISHRFIDLTTLLSQKNIGRNLIVEDLWWTPMHLVARCQYNFKSFENPMAKNKYVKGVNKFQGADKVIYKLAYFAKQPENSEKVYTVHHEDRFLGLIKTPVLQFLESSETPFHRIQLFKCDGEIIWDRKNKFSII